MFPAIVVSHYGNIFQITRRHCHHPDRSETQERDGSAMAQFWTLMAAPCVHSFADLDAGPQKGRVLTSENLIPVPLRGPARRVRGR